MPPIPLADADAILDRLRPRVLFSDLDGTLVGRGGSLLAGFDGTPTLAPAKALLAAHQADLTIVLVSGRPYAKLYEVGRVLGIRDAIAELGTVLVVNGEVDLLWGEAPPDLGKTPAQAFDRSGALAWLLDRYQGHLEPHEPLPQDRQGTILLRGQLDVNEAAAALADAGYPWATLVDNGRFNRPFAHLGPGRTHAYHLAPAGVTKATAAHAYLERRGLTAEDAAAIGDAPSDLELTEVVGVVFLVANGAWSLQDRDRRAVIVTESNAGDGWAEAVSALLARRD
jgi:hydroxymethylpyrimidine pyrophosphatase-like HAD family hydrolase